MADLFVLNLRECREMYESYRSHLARQHVVMPTGMAFKDAAQEVYDAVGPEEFGKLLEAIRELHKTEDTNLWSIGSAISVLHCEVDDDQCAGEVARTSQDTYACEFHSSNTF